MSVQIAFRYSLRYNRCTYQLNFCCLYYISKPNYSPEEVFTNYLIAIWWHHFMTYIFINIASRLVSWWYSQDSNFIASALVLFMAWRCPENKPLPEPLVTHITVINPLAPGGLNEIIQTNFSDWWLKPSPDPMLTLIWHVSPLGDNDLIVIIWEVLETNM